MIRIKNPSEDATGEWFDYKVRGERIRLKVRPLTVDILEAIRNRHKEVKMARDPQTRQMTRVTAYDDEKVNDALIDHVLEDFSGFGDAEGVVLKPTLENKKLVMNVPTLEEELPVASFVFEKARELAVVVDADKKERAENFPKP